MSLVQAKNSKEKLQKLILELESVLSVSATGQLSFLGMPFGEVDVDPENPAGTPFKPIENVWSLDSSADENLSLVSSFIEVMDVTRESIKKVIALAENGTPPGSDEFSFYKNVIGPAVETLAQDILVAKENSFWNNFQGDGALTNYFDPVPKEELFQKLENLILVEGSAPAFLKTLGVQINTVGDVRPPAISSQPGTSIIKSDVDLELSLLERGVSVGEYYIGMTLGKNFSQLRGGMPGEKGKTKKPYIPVRWSPFKQKPNGLPKGWDDPNYQLIDSAGKLQTIQGSKTNYSTGVEFPLGTTVYVTEIVSSATGLWVGFIPVFEGQGSETEEQDAIKDSKRNKGALLYSGRTMREITYLTTKNYQRILYTRPEFLRKKESTVGFSPDPLIKLNLSTGESTFGSNHLGSSAASKTNNRFSKILSDDKINYNWAQQMKPMDVRLSYFNFNKYNELESEKIFSRKLKLFPLGSLSDTYKITHKFSEGYYYFIVGEGQSDVIGVGTSLDVPSSILDNTFDDLLRYLGKDPTANGTIPTNLLSSLKRNYFAPVSTRMQTSGLNKGKQQVLFAIPAAYVDSLPASTKPYFNSFSANSEFFNGNNYAFNINSSKIKAQANGLAAAFKDIKGKVEEFKRSGGKIRNPYDLEYKVEEQIKAFENLPAKIEGFLQRQWSPYTTEQDQLNEIISKAFEDDTSFEHIIQIGLRDNNKVGEDVRLTISYILFSPDPKSLLAVSGDTGKLNLFDFDPYFDIAAADGYIAENRSAVVLRKGLSYLRNEIGDISISESEEQASSLLKTSSVIGTRTLNYFMHAKKISGATVPGFEGFDGDSIDNPWIAGLMSFSVPPLRVYTSKKKNVLPEAISCEELLSKINEMTTELSTADRKILEQFYSRPECKESYFKQFKKPTPAVGPQSSRKEIEKKQKLLEESNGVAYEKLMILYRNFLNNLDPQSLLSLLMSCLQSKFGLPLTSEAICEAVIVKIIEADPMGFKQALIDSNPALAIALGINPMEGLSEKVNNNLDKIMGPSRAEGIPDPITGQVQFSETEGLRIDESYEGAPFATAFAYFGADSYAVNVIKNLEKGGVAIELQPSAKKPPVYDSQGNLERYSHYDIQVERERLQQFGYSKIEANALMVQNGFLTPVKEQYEALGNSVLDALGNTADAFNYPGAAPIYATQQNIDSTKAFAEDAKAWLAWAKNVVDLGQICEAVIGPLLNLPRDLLRGEGFESSYYDNYWENLQKMFAFPTPRLDMSDNLNTNSFMGNYGDMLLDSFLGMVGTMLGQILNLIISHYLNTCFEQDDESDRGSPLSRNNSSELIPDIGKLAGFRGGESVGPEGVRPNDLQRWLVDLVESLSSDQLCALLKTDASLSLLNRCVEFTRKNHSIVYTSGVDSGAVVQSIFTRISEDIDLDICDTIQGARAISTGGLCAKSEYDSAARITDLIDQGLTDEEARRQFARELEDLNSTVKDLADLLYPNANPLANKIPNICGPEGEFSLPPGIKDTMNRVTDNILTNVQGSLMQDLSTLKFFSLPSRALLAATDPSEMSAATRKFSEAVEDPFKEECFVFVGPAFTNISNDLGGSEIRYNNTNYCLTYNEHMHYNLASYFDTTEQKTTKLIFNSMKEADQGDNQARGRVGFVGTDSTLEDSKVYNSSAPTYVDQAKQIIRGNMPSPTSANYLRNTTDMFSHNEFMPVLITEFLNELPPDTLYHSIKSTNPDAGQLATPLDLAEELESSANKIITNKSIKYFNKYKDRYTSLTPYIELHAKNTNAQAIDISNNNTKTEINKIIYSELARSIKPLGLHNLVYSVDMLLDNDAYDSKPQEKISSDESAKVNKIKVGGAFGLATSPGHSNYHKPTYHLPFADYMINNLHKTFTTTDFTNHSRKYIWKNKYKLSDRLIDINPNPQFWHGMLAYFTGAKVDQYTIFNPDINEDPSTVDKDYVWKSTNPGIVKLTESPHYPGDGRSVPYELQVGEKTGVDMTKINAANDLIETWNAQDEDEKQYADKQDALEFAGLGGDLSAEVTTKVTEKIFIGNLMWSFMNMTLSEASGLTTERVQAIYPKLTGAGGIKNVLLTTVFAPCLTSNGKLHPVPAQAAEAAEDSIEDALMIGNYNLYEAAAKRYRDLKPLSQALSDALEDHVLAKQEKKEAWSAWINSGMNRPSVESNLYDQAAVKVKEKREISSEAEAAYKGAHVKTFNDVYMRSDVIQFFLEGADPLAYQVWYTGTGAPGGNVFLQKILLNKFELSKKALQAKLEAFDQHIQNIVPFLDDMAQGEESNFELAEELINPAIEELRSPILGYHAPFDNKEFSGAFMAKVKTEWSINHHPQIVPLAVTFDKHFRKPDTFDDAGFYEMGDRLINEPFYTKLGDPEVFPQYLGFRESSYALYRDGGFFNAEHTPPDPSTYKNFNPNALRYSFPIENKIIYGVDQAGITKQIDNIFSDLTTVDPDGQIEAISDSVSLINSEKELWYQNGTINNIYSNVQDEYYFVKGKLRQPNSNYPPAMIKTNSEYNQIIANPTYSYAFINKFSEDVSSLIKSLYPNAPLETGSQIDNHLLRETVNEDFSSMSALLLESGKFEDLVVPSVSSQFTQYIDIEDENFKAKIFGKLLRNKFEKTYKEYGGHQGSVTTSSSTTAALVLDAIFDVETNTYIPPSPEQAPSPEQVEELMSSIEFNLSTYGFSALQFAYSNQMFARLRNSRINRRKYLRKLWDKILKTPSARGKASRVDPACQDLFNQLAITSTEDLKETNSDFFNIGLVKNHIMDYYQKAICKDVYEASPDGENAVKNSLIQGVVLLMVKVYSLEMCLSSIVSWDAFSLEDVFEDDIIIKIIIENMLKDVGNAALLTKHARDIVNSQQQLSYEESWQQLTDTSALSILIKQESKTISSVVEDIFVNGERISSGLNLEKLSNADPDFVDRYRNRYEIADGELLLQEAEILKSFYLNYGYEIVIDAKMSNNIYTLNYGYPYKNQNSMFKNVNSFKKAIDNSNLSEDDIVGSSTKRNLMKNRQRDYFHSLPTRPIYKNTLGDLSLNSLRPQNLSQQNTSFYKDTVDDFINAAENWKTVGEIGASESARDVVFSDMFRGLLPYDKENIHELSVGNEVNAQLGNFLIQPYVKIKEQDNLEQFRFTEYVDPYTGEVCDATAGDAVDYSPEEHLPILNIFREGLEDNKENSGPDGANPWQCYLYGYVPLNIWTDFYYNNFLKTIQNNEILTKFFNKFGLAPFFESIEVGFRLTYASTGVVDNSKELNFASFMDKHMDRRGLHQCKSLIANRPYATGKSGKINVLIANEIQIPVVEVGRTISFLKKGFKYDTDQLESSPRPYEELGFYSGFDKNSLVADWKVLGLDAIIQEMGGSFPVDNSINGLVRHFSKNFSQLFYRDLAADLLTDLQNTAEFKLLFEHIFPMKRYMALAFLYSGESLSKFISDPTTILQQTKSALGMVFETLSNSDRFEYQPDPLGPGGHPELAGDMGDTRGKDPSLEKQILKIILRTPMLILKGFVEMTDMAIIIAKSIIDIANAIQQAAIGAVEQALRAVKQGIQSAIDEANSAMTEIEVNAASVGSLLEATKTGMVPVWQSLVAPEGWEEEDIDSAIILEAFDEDISKWKFEIKMNLVPSTVKQDASFQDFSSQVDSAAELISVYKEAKDSIDDLNSQLEAVTKEMDEKVTQAKQVLKDIFSSPWLLPSLWAALIPSQMPFLGGLVPIPFFVGPPSTIPGMIYLALLFIDGWEEKQHEQSTSMLNQDGVNCEDEL